jgi:methylated-DNA-protein-cysteine methyltransferase-like protein
MKSNKKPTGVTRPKTFGERVVELALMIPKGKVATYGHIAKAAGGGGQAARSVTAILGKAHQAGVTQIPFHRIVYAGGRVWLDDTYRTKRMRLYKEEGIEVDKTGKISNFWDILYEFK